MFFGFGPMVKVFVSSMLSKRFFLVLCGDVHICDLSEGFKGCMGLWFGTTRTDAPYPTGVEFTKQSKFFKP